MVIGPMFTGPRRFPSVCPTVRFVLLWAWLPAGARAADTPQAESANVASINGNTGLWKVLTADGLPAHQFSVSTWYDRINRNTGQLEISTLGLSGAVGVTNRIEFGVSFEANRQVSVARLDQLSFGQQALGFFGNKT